MYCVYLTFYYGNKLPPFYLGYGSLEKIERKDYHGSVSSKKYSKIWKQELRENPHLFKTQPIIRNLTRKQAIEKETELQVTLNVVKNPLYINEGIWPKQFAEFNVPTRYAIEKAARTNRGKPSWNKGKSWPEEIRRKVSQTKRGHKYGPMSDERKRNISAAKKGKASNRPGYKHEYECKQKIGNANKGRIAVNDGVNTRFIKDQNEINLLLQQGWILGSLTNEKKGKRISINKNGVVKEISQYDLDTYLTNGWILGRGKRKKPIKKRTTRYIWATNGVANLQIKEGSPIPDGFKQGRMTKSVDRIWINNDIQNKFVLKTELKQYVTSDPLCQWKIGRYDWPFRRKSKNSS